MSRPAEKVARKARVKPIYVLGLGIWLSAAKEELTEASGKVK